MASVKTTCTPRGLEGEPLGEVPGYQFEIPRYGRLVVHKDLHTPTLWTVTEPDTGTGVCSRLRTRKLAIEEAERVLRVNYTPDLFQQEKQAQVMPEEEQDVSDLNDL